MASASLSSLAKLPHPKLPDLGFGCDVLLNAGLYVKWDSRIKDMLSVHGCYYRPDFCGFV